MIKKIIVALAIVALAISPMVVASAGSAQIEDKLFSTMAFVSPNGENVVFLDSVTNNGRNMPVFKVFNVLSNTTKEMASNILPHFGTNWSGLASDKYFCWVDDTYSTNGSPNISYYDFSSGKTSQIAKTPAFILNLTVDSSFAVWTEASHDAGLSIWSKNLADSSEAFMITKLDQSQSDGSSLSAFSWKGKDYALFDVRFDGKSTIKLYNLTDKTETVVSDSEYVEYSPRFQNGKIFFLKSEALDPSYGQITMTGGFIESYSIDSQSPKSIDSYDSLTVPNLLVNTKNQNNFVYTITDMLSESTQVKRYDIGSDASFVAAKFDNISKCIIKPESCDNNILYYTEAIDQFSSILFGIDLVSGNKTTISDSKELKVFCGYSSGRGFYTSISMSPVPGQRRMFSVSDIKLMVWSN